MAKLILFIFFTVMVFAVLASAGTGNSVTKKIKSGIIRTIATELSVIVVLSLINSCAEETTFNITHDDLLVVFIGIVISLWLLLKWLFSSNTDDEN